MFLVIDIYLNSSLQRQFGNGHSPKFEAGVSAATASGTRISHFLPTSRRIVQFSNGRVCSCNVMINHVFPFTS